MPRSMFISEIELLVVDLHNKGRQYWTKYALDEMIISMHALTEFWNRHHPDDFIGLKNLSSDVYDMYFEVSTYVLGRV